MIRGRLLVIEGDRGTWQALQATFIRMGWEVAVFLTLAEGLATLEYYTPDWVIVSSKPPDGPCDVVIATVRADKPATRVAVVTWAGDAASLAHLAGLKPDLVLTRPLRSESVYQMCQAIASRAATG